MLWNTRRRPDTGAQQAEARSAEASHRLGVFDHRVSGVQGGLEETDQAVNALKERIDSTNKDLAATQQSLHTTQNSLNDSFNEIAVVRSDLKRNVVDLETRLKNDIR